MEASPEDQAAWDQAVDAETAAMLGRVRPWMVVFGFFALVVAYAAGATPGWTQSILIAGALFCQGIALGAAARGGAIRQMQLFHKVAAEIDKAMEKGR